MSKKNSKVSSSLKILSVFLERIQVIENTQKDILLLLKKSLLTTQDQYLKELARQVSLGNRKALKEYNRRKEGHI
jgi:hypothetical protein